MHIGEFLASVDSFEGSSSQVRHSIARAVSSILGSFLMSVTYSSRDSKFEQLLALFEEGFRLLTLAVPVNFIPALRYVPGSNWAYRRIKRNRRKTADYFRRITDAHRLSYVEGTVRDIVDAYLVQLAQDKARGPPDRDGSSYFSGEDDPPTSSRGTPFADDLLQKQRRAAHKELWGTSYMHLVSIHRQT